MPSAQASSWNQQVIQGTRRFHVAAGCVCAATFLFSLVGSHAAAIQIPNPGLTLFGLLLITGAILPLVIYWHEKNRLEMREATLTIMWAVTVVFTVTPVVEVLGRTGMPLQDETYARIDRAVGVSVPAINAWAAHSAIGHIISATYPLLFLMVPVAILAPAVTGNWAAARQFITANLVAYLIGFTIFALAPAVGPWYGMHFQPDPGQQICQAELLALRAPGPFIPHTPGIICCPSFHVIWAILSAYALSNIRILKIPAALLAVLIILSTMTTGWHYFADVLAGIAVAIIAIRAAKRLCAPRLLTHEALQPSPQAI